MARAKLHHTETHRTCYRCRTLKPNDAFTWRANGTPFSACKECNKEMARERRALKRTCHTCWAKPGERCTSTSRGSSTFVLDFLHEGR